MESVDRAARDRTRWNRRYHERRVFLEPASVLKERTDLLTGGRALDLACGTGGSSLFLAGFGYRVDAVDISEIGLRIAQAAARQHGMDVNWIQADARRLPMTGPQYDCIVVFRYLLRSVIPALVGLLRPQGVMFYVSYNVRRLDKHPDFNRDYLLEMGELRSLLASLSTVVWREAGDVSTFVGRKSEP